MDRFTHSSITKVELGYLQEIGDEGQNSKVWKAKDIGADRIVAVKKVPKSDFRDVLTYYQEARMLNRARHPNVAELTFAGEDGDDIVVVMPFYERGSLSGLMHTRFLTVREIAKYGLGILSGLHHIHSHGIIHCDIKPTNVMLGPDGRPMMTDFGHSHLMNNQGVAEFKHLYQHNWAPEQLAANVVTVSSDIYQTGLTLYRMCNGDSFFKESRIRAISTGTFKSMMNEGKWPDRSRFLAHIPNRLKRTIRRALAPNPDDRYASALEMANDLALIDECLDWKYSSSGTTHSWAHDTVSVIARPDGSGKWSVVTTKQRAGKSIRVSAGCRDDIESLAGKGSKQMADLLGEMPPR